MGKITRYWNQNRRKIILIAAIVVFLFILIQIVNNLLANTQEESVAKRENQNKPTTSVMTQTKVSEETTNNNTEIIQQFVELGNQKKFQEAYNLLTEDCKEESFGNDVNQFINNYANEIFSTPKTYNIELWITRFDVYTYQITYYENNLLATGGANKNKNYEDYITIQEQGEELKLNINNFIKKEEINKSQTINSIGITVNNKKMYRSYETYTITITNYSNKTIQLNDGQNSKDICLIDKNDVEYSSVIHEIPMESLVFEPGMQRTLNIRFNKLYDSEREIEAIKFSNIILDVQNTQTQDTQKTEIKVEI